MMPSRLLFIAIPVVLILGTVLINTVGVRYMKAAVPSSPMVVASMQTPPSGAAVQTVPIQQVNDNTNLWIGLMSLIALNLFKLISDMFNTWQNVKLKIAFKDLDMKLEENTALTRKTQSAIKENTAKVEESLADKSNNPK